MTPSTEGQRPLPTVPYQESGLERAGENPPPPPAIYRPDAPPPPPLPSTEGPCRKVIHNPAVAGYLHGPDDDTPYTVDGVGYCGRCHRALPEHEYGEGRSCEVMSEHTPHPCRGCLLAGPGRGDCDHFVGLPETEEYDATIDEYGRPHGWCEVCWRGEQLRRLRDRNRRLLEAGEDLAEAVQARIETAPSEIHPAIRSAAAAYQEAAKS